MSAKVNELKWLWHKRTGHCTSKNLKLLSDKNMVKGIPLISEITDVCDACQLRKMRRKPFPSNQALRATK